MSFKRIWSEAQQEACIETCCDFGYSAAKCAKAAAAGGLPGKGASLEPFAPPAATVSSWARVERIRRQELEKAQVNPTDSMMAGAGQLLGEWQDRVMKASSARGKNKPGTDELSRLADAGRKIKALIVELNAPAKPRRDQTVRPRLPDNGQEKATQGPGETKENDGSGFIEALARDPRRDAQPHNDTPPSMAQRQGSATTTTTARGDKDGEGGSEPDRALSSAV